jgi:hypothetical protein
MEQSVRYCSLIPAENPVRTGKPLNILLVVQNTLDKSVLHTIRLYGNDGFGWRELLAQEKELPAHDHAHLYFQIPQDRFEAAFWDGEAPEELELLAGDALPGPGDTGLLLFLE